MATAIDIIKRALRSIGVIATGENPSAEMSSDALDSLNDVIAGMSNENLAVYVETQDSLTLTGATSYTYGLTGNINTARPTSIDSAFYRDSSGNDYPLSVITRGEYDAIVDKDETGDYPSCIFVAMTYPLATIYVYPASSTGTIKINARKAVNSYANLTDDIALPAGYERMLRYALAVELMPEYGVNNPQVYQMYIDAKADLKRTNTSPAVMRVSLPFGNGRAADIRSGV